MKGEIDAIRQLIAPLFVGATGGPYSVYLYGSRATGWAHPESDYDFALIAPETLEREALWRFRDALVEALDCEVDCVDMRQIPLTLAAQVLESGIALLSGDEGERAKVETRLMSMYASLNEERAGILEDIIERGSVHAR